MKLLIIGDLHGAMPKIHFKDFDAIIVVGDICSDHGIREAYMKMYKGYVKNVNNYYDWWEITGKKKAKQYTLNSIRIGKKILKKLDSYGKPIIAIPGNWDWAVKSKESWKLMEKNYWKDYVTKGHKNLNEIDRKIFRLNDALFIGYGKVNGPELIELRGYGNIPKKRIIENRKRYKNLFRKFDEKLKKAKKRKLPIIFLAHNVPYNTKIDTIIDKKNPLNGKHYGSFLARKIIEKHQPLLSIGGHMHEHFGKTKIGKTTCINTGFGPDVNTLVEIRNGKIKSIDFKGKAKKHK